MVESYRDATKQRQKEEAADGDELYLAIGLGNTNTSAALLNSRTGKITMLRFGEKDKKHTHQMPTAVCIKENQDQVLVGEEALKQVGKCAASEIITDLKIKIAAKVESTHEQFQVEQENPFCKPNGSSPHQALNVSKKRSLMGSLKERAAKFMGRKSSQRDGSGSGHGPNFEQLQNTARIGMKLSMVSSPYLIFMVPTMIHVNFALREFDSDNFMQWEQSHTNQQHDDAREHHNQSKRDEQHNLAEYDKEKLALFFIFSKLKAQADAQAGTSITKVSIALPGDISEMQRESIFESLDYVGFETVDWIREPIATLLAFEVELTDVQQDFYLVFHCGGSTTDVSLVTNWPYPKILKHEKALIGGNWVDQLLLNYLMSRIQIENSTIEPKELVKITELLKKRVVSLKHQLSTKQKVKLNLNFLSKYDLSFDLTQSDLYQITLPFLESCVDLVKKMLVCSYLEGTRVSQVILTGGTTRIPALKDCITDQFDGFSAINFCSERADEVYAYGAACRQADLSNIKCEKIDACDYLDAQEEEEEEHKGARPNFQKAHQNLFGSFFETQPGPQNQKRKQIQIRETFKLRQQSQIIQSSAAAKKNFEELYDAQNQIPSLRPKDQLQSDQKPPQQRQQGPTKPIRISESSKLRQQMQNFGSNASRAAAAQVNQQSADSVANSMIEEAKGDSGQASQQQQVRKLRRPIAIKESHLEKRAKNQNQAEKASRNQNGNKNHSMQSMANLVPNLVALSHGLIEQAVDSELSEPCEADYPKKVLLARQAKNENEFVHAINLYEQALAGIVRGDEKALRVKARIYFEEAECRMRLNQSDQMHEAALYSVSCDQHFTKGYFAVAAALIEIGKTREDGNEWIAAGIKTLEQAIERGKQQNLKADELQELEIAFKVALKIRSLKQSAEQADNDKKTHEALAFYLEKLCKLQVISHQKSERDQLESLAQKLEEYSKADAKVAVEQRSIPVHLLCQLSGDFMTRPVLLPSGITYEEDMIEQCFQLQRDQAERQMRYEGEEFEESKVEYKCPVTQVKVDKNVKIANRRIKRATEDFLKNNPWAYDFDPRQKYNSIRIWQ